MIAPAADTIAAIATAAGRGGVGIVRVSGSRAAEIAGLITARKLQPRIATVAAFIDARGELIDRGLALFFQAPNSYTGEPVLELHAHGGALVLRLLLSRCLDLGARLAQPGEFTQRAFLNGKLDLAQAESVADLIDAATATAARAAARSLSGAFSRAIEGIVDALIELRMLTEATLDFPEEEIDFVQHGNAAARVATLRERLAQVLAKATQGALLRDGCSVVLIGQPNVGKSSLLNALAGDDVAIVTEFAGTTRDTVSRAVDVGGVPAIVVDTAGLRATADPIERLGIERTWGAVRAADLALVLVDARDQRDVASALGRADAAILAQLPPALPAIIVHNKVDLVVETMPSNRSRSAQQEEAQNHGASSDATPSTRDVWLSAKTGEGIDRLRALMLEVIGASDAMEGTFLARERHLIALRQADAHLACSAELMRADEPALELFAEELRGAQNALATIMGAFSADDLLGEIFARFCIGK